MKVFLLAVAVLVLVVAGMCFNLIFRKDGHFPETEISHNREMRRRGIRCAKEEELKLWGRKNRRRQVRCSDIGCEACEGCKL